MTEVTIRLPDSACAALRLDPSELGAELRLVAAVKWFELGVISQERGAEIAGLPRAEFIATLSRFKVSPFQYSANDVQEEVSSVR